MMGRKRQRTTRARSKHSSHLHRWRGYYCEQIYLETRYLPCPGGNNIGIRMCPVSISDHFARLSAIKNDAA